MYIIFIVGKIIYLYKEVYVFKLCLMGGYVLLMNCGYVKSIDFEVIFGINFDVVFVIFFLSRICFFGFGIWLFKVIYFYLESV